MTRIGLYDGISVACLLTGGVTGIVSVWNALQTSWLEMAVFAFASFIMWRLSSNFAQLAIAASGRQK